MQHKLVQINELRDAFFSLKLNKSLGYEEISFNVVKKCFNVFCEPYKHVFNLYIETGVFLYKLKIALVSPVYKTGGSSDLTNCRPISVPPCFSKILERTIYNYLFSYVSQEKSFISKTI